jgi:hypothetical protein
MLGKSSILQSVPGLCRLRTPARGEFLERFDTLTVCQNVHSVIYVALYGETTRPSIYVSRVSVFFWKFRSSQSRIDLVTEIHRKDSLAVLY